MCLFDLSENSRYKFSLNLCEKIVSYQFWTISFARVWNLPLDKCYLDDYLKEDETEGACSTFEKEDKYSYGVSVRNPDGKGPLGRSECVWEDSKFRMDPNKLYDSWRDRYKWRAGVSTYRKELWAPGNAGNVLNSRGTIVVSRKDSKPIFSNLIRTLFTVSEG